ncbi:hypothetical protein N878_16780 [Pseudomonas sp. EGD-AK9]|nr:hypothetical protein N878_16780 [Pseudomonas sp. EGD-AK9]
MTLLIRWGSYPLIFGGSAILLLSLLQRGIPAWPASLPVVALALLAVALLERLQPFRRSWLEDHDDSLTDAIHLLVNLGLIQLGSLLLGLLGPWLSLQLFPLHWPWWVQLLLVAALIDCSLYLMHRASHRFAWLWRLHAPHHSAERLYWVNGERRHPLSALLLAGPGLVLLALLGAPAQLCATWFALLTVHLAFQHANLDYDLGPLRRLLAVAQMHRWHHKRDFEDAQVNFGEFLLLWDWLLGSYHDSAERLGEAEVGLRERDYPRGYLGQLWQPFRRVTSSVPGETGKS